jgi:hypothetical protein
MANLRLSAASVTSLALMWEYVFSVNVIVEWPSNSMTSRWETPCASRMQATPWRRIMNPDLGRSRSTERVVESSQNLPTVVDARVPERKPGKGVRPCRPYAAGETFLGLADTMTTEGRDGQLGQRDNPPTLLALRLDRVGVSCGGRSRSTGM